MAAVHEAIPLRQCTSRLPASACVLAEMGRCGAPCVGTETQSAYGEHANAFRSLVAQDPSPVVVHLQRRIDALSESERYEDAAHQRDRLSALLRSVTSLQRVVALTSVPELVAARPTRDLGWELCVVRHGRLAAAGVLARGAPAAPYVEALLATAETVVPGPGPLPAASAEEVRCLLRWLDGPDVRLVRLEGTYACPVSGAERWQDWLSEVREPRSTTSPFDDRRALRPVSRPARSFA